MERISRLPYEYLWMDLSSSLLMIKIQRTSSALHLASLIAVTILSKYAKDTTGRYYRIFYDGSVVCQMEIYVRSELTHMSD